MADKVGAQKAGTAVPEGAGHAKVFPPLDPGTFAPQLIWLALTFGLLYLALKRVVLPSLTLRRRSSPSQKKPRKVPSSRHLRQSS